MSIVTKHFIRTLNLHTHFTFMIKFIKFHTASTMTPPHSLMPFLYAKGSLTTLLEQQARQVIRVQVVRECYQPLDFSHKKEFDLPMHRPTLAWVREVLLFGDDTEAWVRAKSIFPLPSLTGNAKRLRHLKHTPIGYVMFKHNRQLPYKRTIFYDEHQKHWGRNTIYDWQGRAILVQEVFLKDLKIKQ